MWSFVTDAETRGEKDQMESSIEPIASLPMTSQEYDNDTRHRDEIDTLGMKEHEDAN